MEKYLPAANWKC